MSTKTQSQHTPGPWDYDIILDICTESDDLSEGGNQKRAEANARLIAAAPEQYQVLLDAPQMDEWAVMTVDEMRESMRGYVEWFYGQRAAAIAKVEGKQ